MQKVRESDGVEVFLLCSIVASVASMVMCHNWPSPTALQAVEAPVRHFPTAAVVTYLAATVILLLAYFKFPDDGLWDFDDPIMLVCLLIASVPGALVIAVHQQITIWRENRLPRSP